MSELATSSQELVAWVRSDERRNQIEQALPEGVSIDRFERATATALVGSPDLAKLDRASLYLSILRAAQLGLVPDGRQCAIVPFGKTAQLIVMIGGVRDTLAEYGWMLKTGTVRDGDEFEFDEATGIVRHPLRAGAERGAIIGFYGVAIHRDGRQRMGTYMSVEEVNDVRDKAGVANNPAWKKWYEQMGQKTVGHRLADDVPLAPQDRRRVEWIISARELDPGEAATMLYGPQDHPELSATPPDVEIGAGEASPGTSASPAPAPFDDEPEPSPEPVQETLEPPTVTGDEADVAALAAQAAGYVPPNGKYGPDGQHGPKTLAEILALGDDGERWIKWALSKISEPPEYAAAVWSFARVHAVAAYQEAAARKELA